jgi:hypothetical protein
MAPAVVGGPGLADQEYGSFAPFIRVPARFTVERVTTRVALIDLPGLLADVVLDALANERDIDVEVFPAGSPPADILASEPDVVMVGVASPPNPSFSEEFLHLRPPPGLFAISLDGRQAWIHEMSIHTWQMAEVSVDSLRDAVRAIARRSLR